MSSFQTVRQLTAQFFLQDNNM